MFNFIKQYSLRFIIALLTVSLVIGLAGMLLSFCLHEIQHLAFGYSLDTTISSESFFQGVKSSSPLRRVLALLICGIIAGIGWFLLYKYGKKLVSVTDALFSDKPDMPTKETTINALLQIITIALGSPLGKEGGPRQIGALFALLFSKWFNLNTNDTRLLIAGGAGAGLAAVYNVPLGGAIFAFELSWKLIKNNWLKGLVSCLILSFIAAYLARLGLGDKHQYHISDSLSVTNSLLLWALLTGPLFGISAYYFIRITNQAKRNAPKNMKVIYLCLINYAILGIIIIYLPELAGNGKSVVQISFSENIPILFALLLLICKVSIEWSSLRSGVQGGLLTPGLANGALIGIISGGIWTLFFPGTALGAFAVIGAVSFLSSSMRMPATAIVLTFEMTQVHLSFFIPMVICIIGSWTISDWLSKMDKENQSTKTAPPID